MSDLFKLKRKRKRNQKQKRKRKRKRERGKNSGFWGEIVGRYVGRYVLGAHVLVVLTCEARRREGSAKREKQQKLKKKMIQRDGVSVMERVCIGSLAGGIAGGFTNVVLHPIDTVKTKLQTRGASSLYSGPFDVISKVRIISPFFHIINRHGNHHHHHHFLSTVVIVLSHNNRQGNHHCHMLMITFTPQWAC